VLTLRAFLRVLGIMSAVAFDTLKLAQRLEAAGLPPRQAQDVARALSDTIGEVVVTREYLDLRLGEMRAALDLRLGEIHGELDLRLGEVRAALALRLGEIHGELDLRLGEVRAAMATKVELAEAKGEILKWMFGAVGLQTLAILGGVAALFRLPG
jgi:hypothetical protein